MQRGNIRRHHKGWGRGCTKKAHKHKQDTYKEKTARKWADKSRGYTKNTRAHMNERSYKKANKQIDKQVRHTHKRVYCKQSTSKV